MNNIPSSWAGLAQVISPDQQAQVVTQAVELLQHQGLSLAALRDAAQLTGKAQPAVVTVITRLGLVVSPALQAALVQQVVAQAGGLGFLNQLLPSQGRDPGYSEITLTPDGTVWVLQKGAPDFEKMTSGQRRAYDQWRLKQRFG